MKKVKFKPATELKIIGLLGFIKREVTPFGTGAKVDCPKGYLGKTVYLVIVEDEHRVSHRAQKTRSKMQKRGGLL